MSTRVLLYLRSALLYIELHPSLLSSAIMAVTTVFLLIQFCLWTQCLAFNNTDVLAKHVLPIRKIANHHAELVRRAIPGYTTIWATGASGHSFVVDVSFGDVEALPLLLDTGSSTTWVIRTDAVCRDPGAPQRVVTCNFGASYPGPYPDTRNAREFSQRYGNNEKVEGHWIRTSLGIDEAEIVVPNQMIGLVNSARFRGDGVCAGLLGLGLNQRTSGTSVFAVLIASGMPAIYSLTFRGDGSGYLGLGGPPPQDIAPTAGAGDSIGMTLDSRGYHYISLEGVFVGGIQVPQPSTIWALPDSGKLSMFLASHWSSRNVT